MWKIWDIFGYKSKTLGLSLWSPFACLQELFSRNLQSTLDDNLWRFRCTIVYTWVSWSFIPLWARYIFEELVWCRNNDVRMMIENRRCKFHLFLFPHFIVGLCPIFSSPFYGGKKIAIKNNVRHVKNILLWQKKVFLRPRYFSQFLFPLLMDRLSLFCHI